MVDSARAANLNTHWHVDCSDATLTAGTFALDAASTEDLRQLGMIDEPPRVPRRPVVVSAVNVAEADVVGLCRYMKQFPHLPGPLVHAPFPHAHTERR